MINPIPADNIISSILEFPNESRSIEFKMSFPWPLKIVDLPKQPKAIEVVKSILAMSNLRDGGKIIIGVERDSAQKPYIPKGVKKSDLETFDHDIIFEHVRNYGSPDPRFQTLNFKWKKKNFIVFTVQEFLLTPVVCYNASRNAFPILDHTALYTRTDKPETKKATEIDEMHEIIQLAVDKQLIEFSRRQQLLIGTKPDKDNFDKELQDLK